MSPTRAMSTVSGAMPQMPRNPRAALERRMLELITEHAAREEWDPNELATDILEIADHCTPAEAQFLRSVGAMTLAAMLDGGSAPAGPPV